MVVKGLLKPPKLWDLPFPQDSIIATNQHWILSRWVLFLLLGSTFFVGSASPQIPCHPPQASSGPHPCICRWEGPESSPAKSSFPGVLSPLSFLLGLPPGFPTRLLPVVPADINGLSGLARLLVGLAGVPLSCRLRPSPIGPIASL